MKIVSFSRFQVWAVVLLSADMQNVVVNRFQRRSEAENCLCLLSRVNPSNRYTVMYIPLENMMQSIPTEWQMYEDAGDQEVAKMMSDIYAALSVRPLPQVRSLLKTKLRSVEEKYPEVYDTAVREAIVHRLTRWAREVHDLNEFSLSTSYWDL